MHKSEYGAQEWTLANVPIGRPAVVSVLATGSPGALLVHGIHAGASLVVEADAPFGGPRIVRVGRARIAVDRRLASAVRVAVAARRGTVART